MHLRGMPAALGHKLPVSGGTWPIRGEITAISRRARLRNVSLGSSATWMLPEPGAGQVPIHTQSALQPLDVGIPRYASSRVQPESLGSLGDCTVIAEQVSLTQADAAALEMPVGTQTAQHSLLRRLRESMAATSKSRRRSSVGGLQRPALVLVVPGCLRSPRVIPKQFSVYRDDTVRSETRGHFRPKRM